MINTFDKKFETIKNYKEKIPGVANGLEILEKLNEKTPKISNSNELYYYDFKQRTIKGYSLFELNMELQLIYNSRINVEVLSKNRLYWIFCDLYDRLYQQRNYPYYKGIFTKYDIINKFIQGLRKNKKPNSLKFQISEVMKNFNFMYFEEEISPHKFYLFMLDFIITMQIANVVVFDDYSIEFNTNLETEINMLIYTSYNLMILGENGIFSSYNSIEHDVEPKLIKMEELYKSCGQETKLFINSLTTSLVISSSVEKVCAEENINNIFIESVVKTLE